MKSKARPLKYFIPIFFVLSIAAAPALAQGEHSRRVAAELLVMLGDARALTGSPARSELHRKGLNDRLRGALSPLAILMRLTDQEMGRTPRSAGLIAEKLSASLNQKNLPEFIETLSGLTAKYPLAAPGLLSATPTPIRLNRAKEIHEDLCAGCHDEPINEVERPAYNLFMQAKAASPTEFAARMIVGVRGDRTTGLGNPLSDEEISGLISYYRSPRQ